MTNDKRDLLTVLKREPHFWKKADIATARERRGGRSSYFKIRRMV